MALPAILQKPRCNNVSDGPSILNCERQRNGTQLPRVRWNTNFISILNNEPTDDMLAVQHFASDNARMKHPSQSTENFEFNLGKAQELRCVYNQKATVCGQCESCKLIHKITQTKQWFQKAGDQTRRRFVLGLIRRIHSIDLLQQVVNVLHPLLNAKDYTYTRNRTNPGLSTDKSSTSSDRNLNGSKVEKDISITWDWFQTSPYWTKSNFLLAILQSCEIHLLYTAGVQTKTLLVSEKKAGIPVDDFYEAGSIATTEYSFNTEDHPEVELLSRASRSYGSPANPFGDPFDEEEIINCDYSDDESYSDDSIFSSIDPSCMVIPTSAKAHSGVSRYRDFIKDLPVHLSKYILSLLDTASLHHALTVSKHWCVLCKEVHDEYDVSQQLWEEVMLMQGAAAQGCNPVYANDIDVLVPNLYPNSNDVITTGEEIMEANFKTEINFQTAYTGYSIRNVIMEERNVYCGAYNIMVLSNVADQHRVVHTDGSRFIAVGSKDRKVRFVDRDSGKEVGPLITGHSGSIRCVCIEESRKFVLSGSYDTSIRMWNIDDGHCMKIFHGHRDTVTFVIVHKDKMASGSKDGSCKVWNLSTGKCIRTFKHRYPVMAIALSDEVCITGCEKGRVKVWNMKTAEIIKRLDRHQKAVTAIKFDRWHIITGSKDGYALAWSSQGKFDRCLTALRHPKEVLCLEFMYLRVVTGSADGKLRIWNMVTGQCLRIMRGNSRSDPILSLVAIENRVTINTLNNLIVLNFENVDWDYTLENDKVPPLVQYGKYSDTPVRQQPYNVIRAKRMEKAGATNPKVIHHDGGRGDSRQSTMRARQLEHSAKTLKSENLQDASRIQSHTAATSGFDSMWNESLYRGESKMAQRSDFNIHGSRAGSPKAGTLLSKPPMSPSVYRGSPVGVKSSKSVQNAKSKSAGKTRPYTSVSMADPPVTVIEDDYKPPIEISRRVSWAFEHPEIPKSTELNLSETKALLRSQIRMKENVIPPDFIYMTLNAIQNSMNPSSEAGRNTYVNNQEKSLGMKTRLERPSSSPSKIDPRTKVPVEELDLDQFVPSSKAESVISAETTSTVRQQRAKAAAQQAAARKEPPATTSCTIGFTSKAIDTKPHISIHSNKVKSSIPKGRVIRPHTATINIHRSASTSDLPDSETKIHRPKTAPTKIQNRPGTATTAYSIHSEASTGGRQRKRHGYTTSATTTAMVPMLMYPPGYAEKMEELRQRKEQKLAAQVQVIRSSSEPALGKVSQYNDPMRTHTKFELRTHEQEAKRVAEMKKITRDHKQNVANAHKMKQKEMWLAKATGKTKKDFARRPKSVAPEIREYWEMESDG